MSKLFRTIACFALALALPVGAISFGFTTHPEGDNHTEGIAWDDLLDVNRWSMIEGTLVDDHVRGLDGGIEYAISSTFCSEIAHHFIGLPVPTCDDLKGMIKRAFDAWADGNPMLRFVDVSDRVDTVLDSPYGAEIDIFALTADQYPKVRSYSAVTSWWWETEYPRGTNGRILPGRSLRGVDVVFSVANRNCYYHEFDPPAIIECNHFESLMMHEIGHALGLSHPDEMPERNFDQDSNPHNVLNISCRNPNAGFRVSWNIDRSAVMNARNKNATPRFSGLSPDDIGGRDFLYPICDLSEFAVISPANVAADLRWGGQLFMMMALIGIAIKIRRILY